LINLSLLFIVCITPFSLREYSSNGTVRVYPIGNNRTVAQGVPVYSVDANGNTVLHTDLRQTLPNGATLLVSQALNIYLYPLVIQGQSFFVNDNNLKVTIELSGWPGNKVTQPVEVDMVFNLSENVSDVVNGVANDPNFNNSIINSTTLQTANTNITMSFLDFFISPSLTDTSVYYSYDMTVVQQFSNGTNLQTLTFVFSPGWTQTAIYDPQLGILFTSTGDGGADGGDGTTTLLLEILIPVCVGGALIAVVGAIVVGLVIAVRKKMLLNEKMEKMARVGSLIDARGL
jgi:hypothetical protein